MRVQKRGKPSRSAHGGESVATPKGLVYLQARIFNIFNLNQHLKVRFLFLGGPGREQLRACPPGRTSLPRILEPTLERAHRGGGGGPRDLPTYFFKKLAGQKIPSLRARWILPKRIPSRGKRGASEGREGKWSLAYLARNLST